MFPIDDPTAATVMPTPEAAGTAGFWTEGNPTLGVEATRVRASFFNGLQAELLAILTAGGVTPDKTTYNQLLQAMNVLYKPGRLLNVQTFTSSTTYVPTAGTAYTEIEVIGAGGAGGGVPTTGASQIAIAAGGASGARAIGRFAVAAVTGQSIVVGAAGTGVAGSSGGDGGASSVGALISANGGQGGTAGTTGGSSGLNGNESQATSSGGNIFSEKGRGAKLAVAIYGYLSYGGDGADGPHGSGGAGRTGLPTSGSSGVGSPASGYGSGGGGAQAYDSSATARAGGNGSPGYVVIKEFA